MHSKRQFQRYLKPKEKRRIQKWLKNTTANHPYPQRLPQKRNKNGDQRTNEVTTFSLTSSSLNQEEGNRNGFLREEIIKKSLPCDEEEKNEEEEEGEEEEEEEDSEDQDISSVSINDTFKSLLSIINLYRQVMNCQLKRNLVMEGNDVSMSEEVRIQNLHILLDLCRNSVLIFDKYAKYFSELHTTTKHRIVSSSSSRSLPPTVPRNIPQKNKSNRKDVIYKNKNINSSSKNQQVSRRNDEDDKDEEERVRRRRKKLEEEKKMKKKKMLRIMKLRIKEDFDGIRRSGETVKEEIKTFFHDVSMTLTRELSTSIISAWKAQVDRHKKIQDEKINDLSRRMKDVIREITKQQQHETRNNNNNKKKKKKKKKKEKDNDVEDFEDEVESPSHMSDSEINYFKPTRTRNNTNDINHDDDDELYSRTSESDTESEESVQSSYDSFYSPKRQNKIMKQNLKKKNLKKKTKITFYKYDKNKKIPNSSSNNNNNKTKKILKSRTRIRKDKNESQQPPQPQKNNKKKKRKKKLKAVIHIPILNFQKSNKNKNTTTTTTTSTKGSFRNYVVVGNNSKKKKKSNARSTVFSRRRRKGGGRARMNQVYNNKRRIRVIKKNKNKNKRKKSSNNILLKKRRMRMMIRRRNRRTNNNNRVTRTKRTRRRKRRRDDDDDDDDECDINIKRKLSSSICIGKRKFKKKNLFY